MARRAKGPKPTLDGVIRKIERADLHFQEFEREWAKDEASYSFEGKVAANKVDHVYFPVNPPAPKVEWSLAIGDCVHNLRSALDHLAYLLVRSPNRKTQFPIRDTRPYRRVLLRKRPAPIQVNGRITTAALDLIESVQPYNGTDDGEKLRRIHELDAIDKHRHLLLSTVAIDYYVTSVSEWVGPSESLKPPQPPVVDRWHDRTAGLKHGKPAARLTYERPYTELDPNLKMVPGVAFGKSMGSVTGDPVRMAIGPLMPWLRDEFVPRFNLFLR